MIAIRDQHGVGMFYLAAELIEAIMEDRGNTCEIRTTTGRIYNSIESKDDLAERVNKLKLELLAKAMKER